VKKKVSKQHIELEKERIKDFEVKWDYDIDVKQSLPTLLNDKTNFISNVHSCVISVEQEQKGYQSLEDVVQDIPLENLSCVSLSTSLNSLASKHSYVHRDINFMISIYHSHIDVHMDFDTGTNDVFPYFLVLVVCCIKM